MRTPSTHKSLHTAKQALGREVRMLEGFAGIGLGRDGIRLYVEGLQTPVVAYVQQHYGDHYAGYGLDLIETPGFRTDILGS